MQTNYYFLKQLSQQLSEELEGLVLAECFSQEKDELVLGFCSDGRQWRKQREFYIKAIIRPDFVCFNFPDDFRRASKNSVGLFTPLINKRVLAVRQFQHERCFSIVFEDDFQLLFKLFGNRSNLILCQNGEILDLFHSKLVADFQLDVNALDRSIDQSYDAFVTANGDWRKLFPTFGKELNLYLQTALNKETDIDKRWAKVQEVLAVLAASPSYFVKTIAHQPAFSLLPPTQTEEALNIGTNPLEALNNFYYAFTKQNAIEREKGVLLRLLQKQQVKTQAYLEHQYQKLGELDEDVKNEEIGHILMANLHEVPERADKVVLYDFYRDCPITIKLKPDLSPQKNAENYYRKSKNEKIEIAKLQENIEQKETFLLELTTHIDTIVKMESLKLLRKYAKEHGLDRPDVLSNAPESLFKYLEYQGYDIFIGKNAKNNDLLTQRHARKDDLWLHARDVTGSHVVVRHQAGKKTPNSVIERAAQLAAYFSKRKTDTLCPVIVTPKKFVRKTRDLAEGQVIVEKEEVVMVEPVGING